MAGLGFAEKAESLLIRACPERTRHWGSRRNHGKVPPPGEQRVIECWEILRTRSIKVRSTGAHTILYRMKILRCEMRQWKMPEIRLDGVVGWGNRAIDFKPGGRESLGVNQHRKTGGGLAVLRATYGNNMGLEGEWHDDS